MKRLLPIALTLVLASAANAAEYEIDGAHASTGFSVRHLMVSNVRGQFADMKGTVVYDANDLSKTKVEATIPAATIDTRIAKRDTHLKSEDFLWVEKHPELTFKSTKVTKGADGKLKLQGDLQIRGVTKSVVFDVEGPTPEIIDPWGKSRMGASATATINRKDFGLHWNKVIEAGGVTVGDEVKIEIDLELIKKEAAAPAQG